MLSVSVILPTYNERDNIAILLRQIHETLAGRGHEILVVDDDSPDGTGEAVRAAAAEIPAVRLLTKPRKEGIGAALRYGCDRAEGEILVTMDADLSFSPADIPRLLEPLERGYDLALGSRHMPGGGYEAPRLGIQVKYLISRFGNFVVRHAVGLELSDFSANFRAIRRSTWHAIGVREKSNYLLLETILKAARAGRRIAEVPVVFSDRRHGRSKLDLAVELPKFLVKLVRFKLFG